MSDCQVISVLKLHRMGLDELRIGCALAPLPDIARHQSDALVGEAGV